MKYMKVLAATAAVAALTVSGIAQAQDMKFWRIGTGGAGGTYYPIGGLIANAISNPPGSRPCDKGGSCGVAGLVAIAVSTNASVANVNAIDAGGSWTPAWPARRASPRAITARASSKAIRRRTSGSSPTCIRKTCTW